MEQQTLTYKMASKPEEMEQIYKLNYETFVEEIPQYEGNRQHRLVDRFDDENIYFIAKDKEEVVGMIAVRANRPFSLDQKLNNLDEYLPEDANPCEVRLLSIKKEYRKTLVFYQLIQQLVNYCLEKQYNMALISGTERQLRLYKRIGFEPFGPMVGTEGARFQPMYLTEEKFETSTKAFRKVMLRKKRASEQLNFLPGPVAIKKEVEQAFSQSPISHRSEQLIDEMKLVRKRLCRLVNANQAQIMVGTGTLANDIVAAQIKNLPGKGLILANGEFGYRLIDHAVRMDLSFTSIEKEWNEELKIEEVEAYLEADEGIEWIWTVHCETSTGYLYDLESLKRVARNNRIKLCIDACSSVGVTSVDLEGVYLASTVSGKGLGSYPGLAIIFHQESIHSNKEIPRYLDLGAYAEMDSIPYTHSSNLLYALREAIKYVDVNKKLTMANTVKQMFRDAGFSVLGDKGYSPGIMTIQLPHSISSVEIGDELKKRGFITSYESGYLLERNWIQFAFMGNLDQVEYEAALAALQAIMNRKVKKV